MIGCIIGDIAGSTYEFEGNKDKTVPLFPLGSYFTDDSILAIATADALLSGCSYRDCYLKYGAKYPNPMGGYGARFSVWLRESNPQPYGSWGNGAAMRIAPVGWAFDTLEKVMEEAERSASVSHNHVEGIAGAQSVAAAIWLARHKKTKEAIRTFISTQFGYNLDRTVNEVWRDYEFDESCAGTVPEALIAFLDSNSFENAIRIAISLGGDADTLACITGAIAEAYYGGIPEYMQSKAENLLDPDLLDVVRRFKQRYQ